MQTHKSGNECAIVTHLTYIISKQPDMFLVDKFLTAHVEVLNLNRGHAVSLSLNIKDNATKKKIFHYETIFLYLQR